MTAAAADGLCPYKGLIPYTEQDAAFFFGREQDQAIITANLMSTRLTVLYGPTGAGKSSVLRAGVAHALNVYAQQTTADDGQPDVAVLVFNNWRDNPLTALAGAIHTTITKALRAADRPGVDETLQLDLEAALERWARHFKGELLIILDQFEEFFLYHAQEDGPGTFAVEFPAIVNRADLHVNFVLSLREDALSKLDRFKGRLPQLFDNYLRMPRLTRAAAREAIIRPLDEYNRRQPDRRGFMSIEPALVEAVLEQVQTGRVTLARAGSGGGEPVATAEAGQSIETAYLQLVLIRLWNEELRQGSHQLRLRTLNALKGAENIVRTHLDTVMSGLQPDARDTATEVLRYLVTPSGTKIAYTAADLAIYAKTPVARLTPVLESLTGSGVRILRTVEPPPDQPQATRYEIFHDVLAQAVLDWCARYEQEKEKRRLQTEIAQVQQQAQQTLLEQQQQAQQTLREQQRAQELLDARKLAEAEKRRAEDQARAAQQLRRRNRLVSGAALVAGLMALAALVFGVLAGQSRSAAQAANDLSGASLRTANAANTLSSANLGTAQAASTEAIRQANLALTNGLAAQTAQAAQATAVIESTNNAAQAATSGAYIISTLNAQAAGTAAAGTPDFAATSVVEQSQLDEAESKRLAGLSGEFVSSGDQRLALLLAVEAYNTFSSQAATDALLAALDVNAAYSLEPLPGLDRMLNGKIYAVAFSPDGRTLAAVSDAGEILEQPLGGNAALQYRNDQPGRLFAVAYSPDGLLLAVGSDVSAASNVWEAAGVSNGKPVRPLGESADWLLSVDFNPQDSGLLALGRVGSDIFLWDWGRASLAARLSGHRDDVWSVAWSPNGKRLASGSADGTVRLWEGASGAPAAILEGHSDVVRSVAWSPDGTLLASGSRDNTILLWDGATGNRLALLKGHTGEVRSVAFSPDGKLLASGGADQLILVWNVADQSIVAEIKNNDNAVTSLAFTTLNGEVLLAAGSYDQTLKLYRVQGDQLQSDGPLTAQACGRAQSNFTVEEWFRFFSVDYRVTCPEYSAGS